jgi:hypothetical protein
MYVNICISGQFSTQLPFNLFCSFHADDCGSPIASHRCAPKTNFIAKFPYLSCMYHLFPSSILKFQQTICFSLLYQLRGLRYSEVQFHIHRGQWRSYRRARRCFAPEPTSSGCTRNQTNKL